MPRIANDRLGFYEHSIADLHGIVRRCKALEPVFENDPEIQRTIREIRRNAAYVRDQLILAMQKEKEQP